MRIWHLTADADREPLRVAPEQRVRLTVGTSPVAPGQSVWVTFEIIHANGKIDRGFQSASWDRNEGLSSYWRVVWGPFARGDRVSYVVHGSQGDERIDLPPAHFVVGPRIYVGLLWHQHQPVYADMSRPPQGRLTHPWVRLHALRAYYAMPMVGAAVPGARVTFNLTPSLLWQIEQYTNEGATDPLLDLTLKPADRLTPSERETVLDRFFDADWHHQIFPFQRYLELFQRRREGLAFDDQDVRDLQMWYNLAWFAPQFQTGTVDLPTGEQASVQRWMAQESGFSQADIEAMVAEQYKVMRAIIPLYRKLRDEGRIELSTTPFYHPILPLLYDTDGATLDRPGTCKPQRFHYPEDADAQVEMAVRAFNGYFGAPPQGMWPAEGAVSADVIPIFVRHGIQWIATDQGVLEKSGRWGYEVGNPEVLCRPYQVQAQGRPLAVFFRNAALSNLISFHYHQAFEDMDLAAEDFARHVVQDLADRFPSQEDRIVTVVLDGENTWGAYGPSAPAFLHSLYRRLSENPEIQMVGLGEYVQGNAARAVSPHPAGEQERVYELYTGSWIDEPGSDPGVDLGVWVGEADENRAWGLLGDARRALTEAGVTPQNNPRAFQALYTAEGSDWFWWLGTDRGRDAQDQEFESLFRLHLTNAYRFAGLEPPPALQRPLRPWGIVWTFTQARETIRPHEALTVRTNCPGSVIWRLLPSGEMGETLLEPAGGVDHLANRYEATLGPFAVDVQEVRLSFRCQEHLLAEGAACVTGTERTVQVSRPEVGKEAPMGQTGATWV